MSRKASLAEPKVRKWMARASDGAPDFDNPAFKRMADALMTGMIAAGGPEANYERVILLIKCMAMVTDGAFRGLDDATIAERCGEIGSVLFEEVMSLRSATAARSKSRQ